MVEEAKKSGEKELDAPISDRIFGLTETIKKEVRERDAEVEKLNAETLNLRDTLLRLNSLSTQVSSLGQKIRQKDDVIKQLTTRVIDENELDKKIKTLESELSEKEKENEELKKSLRIIYRKFIDEHTRNLGSNKKLNTLSKDIEEKEIGIGKIKEDLNKKHLELEKEEELNERLNYLNKKLYEKQKILAQLIDEIDPLEKSIEERENQINIIKQQSADKDKIIVKLNGDKELLLKEIRQNNARFAELNDIIKAGKLEILKRDKQILMDNNEVGFATKKALKIEEFNKKLILRNKELFDELKKAKHDLETFRINLEQREKYFSGLIETTKKEMENRIKHFAEKSAKENLDRSLREKTFLEKIDSLNKVIEAKKQKEIKMANEISSKFREMLLSEPSSVKKQRVSAPVKSAETEFEEEIPEFRSSEDAFSEEKEGKSASRTDEILPIIEIAIDHGDSIPKIKESLLSSGYSRKEIEESLKLIEIER